jgi:hypothetical protein
MHIIDVPTKSVAKIKRLKFLAAKLIFNDKSAMNVQKLSAMTLGKRLQQDD